MIRKTSILLIAIASMALYACGDDTACTTGESQCSGDQIQVCGEDGTWSEPTDCPEAGQTCSSGHEGMEFVHCMADDHGAGDDHSDDTEDHTGHDHD